MGKIDYEAIYKKNKHGWHDLTEEPQKYEALLAGHYSDSNHFVYELLQNAEDENASKVVIEYHKDRLEFYHNGDPFDEDDVRGVSSMLMGTKDRNDAQTIGRFGMGFKSVFKYTYMPVIYSDQEAFAITNYLLPQELKDGWDYEKTKKELSYPDVNNSKYIPFFDSPHLTRIVIPFQKRDENGTIVSVNGREVLTKLESLSGEILLFLTHIKNLYWINIESGRHVHISLGKAKDDERLITCRITRSNTGGKEEISRFLRYKKVFDHPKMTSAEVSVAYRINPQVMNINEVNHPPVWVYFPTRDETDLPFYIHGSFETAVSREKLMTPSEFNNDLFDKLGDLIAESLFDLANRKLITQVFIRRIILAAFQDEDKNGTIPGLKQKLTQVFAEEKVLPDRKGVYRKASELVIPVPFAIMDQRDSSLWRESFESVPFFVAFNNEKERNFTEYYAWLKYDLQIRIFTLANWAKELYKLRPQKINDYKELDAFYSFLSDYRESLFGNTFSFTRRGPYELDIKNCLSEAWGYLRQAPIVLNTVHELIPAYEGEVLFVYLSSSSKYRTLPQSYIVHKEVAKQYTALLKEGFGITEFDNKQFIKEKILRKYILGEDDQIKFENPNEFQKEYIEDITQLLSLFEEGGYQPDIIEFLQDAYIIKIKTDDGEDVFSRPQDVYVPISDEGIDLTIYYAPFGHNDNTFIERDLVDKEFFDSYGISVKNLKKLGLITSPVNDGKREDLSGKGNNYWRALDEYCPHISIDGIEDNLYYIDFKNEDDISKKKSVEILKLMLAISHKLKGRIRRMKTTPIISEEAAGLLSTINRYSWLYGEDTFMHAPKQISRYELNKTIYEEVNGSREAYTLLGFIEKSDDYRASAFEQVDALNKHDKTVMLRQLAKELGYYISQEEEKPENNNESSEQFTSEDLISEEFPKRKVRNMDSLMDHVRQEFFCADTVRYEKVLRQIRTSKSQNLRAYSLNMYMNDSDVQICQMCKKKTQFPEVPDIANFGIELPQLHLCLCQDCASRYRIFRDKNKENFKAQMTKAIREIDIAEVDDEYKIIMAPNASVSFTQTHLAELKEILSLIDQYGVPDDQQTEERRPNVRSIQAEKASEQQEVPPKQKESTEKTNFNKIYKVGMKIRHKKFGEGIITRLDEPYLIVHFPKYGEKKMMTKVITKD